jgi:hypothetical protein
MKLFLLLATILVLGSLAYSCSSTCRVYPGPGGYTYEQPAAKVK